jgi:3'-phosphoadenosine 5'-phosphosulfate sulfotransferase
MLSRREKVEQMLQAEPHDPFLRYMLANELEKESRLDECLAVFASLRSERHLPSFLRSAQVLVGCEQINSARAILREGIEFARSIGEMHPASEMAELLTQLGNAGE